MTELSFMAEMAKNQAKAAHKQYHAMFSGMAEETKKSSRSIGQVFGDSLKRLTTDLKNPKKGIERLTKSLKKTPLKGTTRAFKNMGNFMGSALGPIFSFIEQLGVLDPIIELIGGLLEIFGGVLLEKLMPVFQKLFDILLSPAVMELISKLADLFFVLIEPLLDLVMIILPPLVDILNVLIPVIMAVVQVLIGVLKPTIEIIGRVIMFIFAGVANIVIGIWNVIVFIQNCIVNLVGWMFGWEKWDFMDYIPMYQHGGISSEGGLAILHPNEAVIPLDSPEADSMLGGGSEEMLNRQEITNELLVELINMKKRKRLGGR